MWVGISEAGIREHNSLGTWPVWQRVGQRVVKLSQAGLQGVEALGEDRRQRCVDGGGGCCGGGGRGQGFALAVGLAVGKGRFCSLSWTLHPQEPGDPLQQN